jgi:threonine/homoserine/homoserine lactone efflux protein
MIAPSFVDYLGVTFALVVTPGASTALVIRNTLLGGPARGLAAAAGAALGNTSYAVASGLGLAVLFLRWPSAPKVLAVAGALYFCWLGGANLLRAAGTLERLDLEPPAPVEGTGLVSRQSFRQGLGVNLLNPAIASFYLGIVPSFIPAGSSSWYFGALAASHVSMAFACHSAWALATARLRHVAERRSSRRWLEVLTGLTMLGLAARVLL